MENDADADGAQVRGVDAVRTEPPRLEAARCAGQATELGHLAVAGTARTRALAGAVPAWFSPTDVMPLSRWAELTMLVQPRVSPVTVAPVIARAVTVLR